MREVLEAHYPEASKVVVVLDNLNTHTPASFYPRDAQRGEIAEQ